MDAAVLELPKPARSSVGVRRNRVAGLNRRALWALLGGVCIACLLEAGWVIAGANFHTVLAGEIYRSAQLPAATLREVALKHGIRSVVNLRGTSDDADWYHAQRRALAEIGVRQFDVNLSSYFLPAVSELQRLVQVLDECPRPLLIHCRRGADRTGVAAALALLLHTDATVPAARQQLGWRYGHIGLNFTDELRRVFELYTGWLDGQGIAHSPARLREFVKHGYRPGHAWAELEPLEVPERLPFGKPTLARFRVWNRSAEAWHFKQAPNAGVHLGFHITRWDGTGRKHGGAGYFDHTLQPGESVDLAFAIPAIRMPGRYVLHVDMADQRLGWFSQLGSPRFERELMVDDAGGSQKK